MNRTLKTQLFQAVFAVAALGALQMFETSSLKDSPVTAYEGERIVMQQRGAMTLPAPAARTPAYGAARIRPANEPEVMPQPQAWDRLPQQKTFVF